ncbi:L-Aspartase-like protein [Camillea tinctor]|nr:L-Aspartase-like protein [Camillea tinctor]
MDCPRDTTSSRPRLPIVRSASASQLSQYAARRHVDASKAKMSEEAVNDWLQVYQYKRVASYAISGVDIMDISMVAAIANCGICFTRGRNADKLRRRLEVASMTFYQHRYSPSPFPSSFSASVLEERPWSTLDPTPLAWVRATIVALISEIEQGRTLARIKTLEGLINLINNDVTPVVTLTGFPEKDLCPEVVYEVVKVLSGDSGHTGVWVGGKRGGKIEPAGKILQSRGMEFIQPDRGELRQIAKSSAYVVGLSALSLHSLEGSLHLAQLLTACLVEVTGISTSFVDRANHQTPGSEDVAANIRGFLCSSQNIMGGDRPVSGETLKFWRRAVSIVPAKLGAMLDDLKLAKEQVNWALARRNECLMDALDKSADKEEDARSSILPSMLPGLSCAQVSGLAPLVDLDIADVLKSINPAHDTTNIEVVSAMHKSHDCIFRLAELIWTQIEGLLDPKTSDDLPAQLCLDGKFSSSSIGKVVAEAESLLTEITMLKIDYDEIEGSLGGSDCEDGLKQRATFAAETCAKMIEKLTRMQACQVYIVTQAADVHYIDDQILLRIFWDALCVSIPRASREIYRSLESIRRADTVCVAVYTAFEQSWRKSGMCTAGAHRDLPSFDHRCDEAIESSSDVLNTCLRSLGFSDVIIMQKLPRWKRIASDNIKSRLKLWPKTRRPATEELLGRGPRQLYLFVRGKLGIPMDSGDIPVFKYGEGLTVAENTSTPSPKSSSSTHSGEGKGKAKAMESSLEDIPEQEPTVMDYIDTIQQSMSAPSGIIDIVMALLAKRIPLAHYNLSGLFPVVFSPLPGHPRMNPHHLARRILKDTTPELPVELKAGPRPAQTPFMHLEQPSTVACGGGEDLSKYDSDSDSESDTNTQGASQKAQQPISERKPGSFPPRGSWRGSASTIMNSRPRILKKSPVDPLRSHPVHLSSPNPSPSTHLPDKKPPPSASTPPSAKPVLRPGENAWALRTQRSQKKKRPTVARAHARRERLASYCRRKPAQVRLQATSVDDFEAVLEEEEQPRGADDENGGGATTSTSSSSSEDDDDHGHKSRSSAGAEVMPTSRQRVSAEAEDMDTELSRDLAQAMAQPLIENYAEEYRGDNTMASGSGSGSTAASTEIGLAVSDPDIKRPFSSLGIKDEDEEANEEYNDIRHASQRRRTGSTRER